MDFRCVLWYKDFVRISDENTEVRFEIKSDEPVIHVSKEYLPKLIKHLQSMDNDLSTRINLKKEEKDIILKALRYYSSSVFLNQNDMKNLIKIEDKLEE